MPKKISPETTTIDGFTLPERAKKHIYELGQSELILAPFKYLVSNYMLSMEYRKTKAPRADTVRHLKTISKDCSDLLQNLELTPEVARALISHELFETHVADSYESLQRRLVDDLHALRTAAGYVAQDIDRRRGEKPKTLEHTLLSDVALLLENYLSMKPVAAAREAAQLLQKCGVHNLPQDPSDARRAVIKIRKGQD